LPRRFEIINRAHLLRGPVQVPQAAAHDLQYPDVNGLQAGQGWIPVRTFNDHQERTPHVSDPQK